MGGGSAATHTPVRGDGLPIFLPPGVGLQGGVILAEEPHQLAPGRLYQGRLQARQADPGEWGVRTCTDGLSARTGDSASSGSHHRELGAHPVSGTFGVRGSPVRPSSRSPWPRDSALSILPTMPLDAATSTWSRDSSRVGAKPSAWRGRGNTAHARSMWGTTPHA